MPGRHSEMFFNPDWRVLDWEGFCGDRKENRREFGFHERHFCREKQQTYKSRSSCSAEAFYVLTLNGIGLDGEAFYTLTLTKIKKSNLWWPKRRIQRGLWLFSGVSIVTAVVSSLYSAQRMCNFILISDKFPAAFFFFQWNKPENFSPKYETIPFQLNQEDKVNFKILFMLRGDGWRDFRVCLYEG